MIVYCKNPQTRGFLIETNNSSFNNCFKNYSSKRVSNS